MGDGGQEEARPSLEAERRALEESEALFEALAEHSPCVVFINTMGRVVFANDKAAEVVGYSKEEFLSPGFDFREVIAPDSRPVVEEAYRAHLDGREVEPYEYFLQARDGGRIPAVITTRLVQYKGSPAILGVIADVSESRRMEEELERSQERFRVLVETSPDAVTVTDLQGKLINTNLQAARLHGYESVEEMLAAGLDAYGLIAPHDRQRAQENARLTLEMGAVRNVEYALTKKDGGSVPCELSASVLRNRDGAPAAFIAVVRDISERKAFEAQIQHDAFHDGLTGLPNRALFLDRVGQAIERAKRQTDSGGAILFLDLDRFKLINESLGHVKGDRVLNEIGHRLSAAIRPGDTAARLSGDEYAVLLDGVDGIVGATQLAHAIQEAIAAPIRLAGKELVLTASVGIAMTSREHERAGDVLRDAQTAMYRARAGGPGGCCAFDPGMRRSAVEQLSLQSDLRHAAEAGELVLHYQPIVALHSGTIVGFEALLRWQHPSQGILLPSRFMQIAEETGIVARLGEMVVRSACAQVAEWRSMGRPELHVAVNFSASQLAQPNVLDLFRNELDRVGLRGDALSVEVTESSTIDSSGHVLEVLRELVGMGVRLSLDDFGTGYSILSNLRRFPIDTIKIDLSFVRDLPDDPDAVLLTEGLVAMAQRLRLTTVAEGVESPSQLECLRRIGCDLFQGFLFSRAVAPDEAVRLLVNDGRPG